MFPTLELAKELIAKSSISPHDAGCQAILAARLEKLGFQIEMLPFGNVTNMWARFGTAEPVFVFAGHTDVVPTGPIEKWQSDPFVPTIRDDYLFGRGAADMKSSIAAMVVACENFLAQNPNPKGSIAFLITSDEESLAIDGTKKVVEHLKARNEKITWCLIGEATCESQFPDTIKIGRRGSLSGELTILGVQGHIAYPQNADNPIHNALAALQEMTMIDWDQGNEYFQPTSFQISNIHAGTGATNVIPGQLEIHFNFRYSPESTAEKLMEHLEKILKLYELDHEIKWHHSSLPFMSQPGKLAATAQAICESTCGILPKLSTTGGTSDGKFISTMDCEIIELGPCNETIHQIDECVNLADLQKLTDVYQQILAKLLS
jgi:succinyl-diaminopimelate desuccinylase